MDELQHRNSAESGVVYSKATHVVKHNRGAGQSFRHSHGLYSAT